MEYAKIENGIIKYAPKNLGKISNFNQNTGLLIEHGYLPVERQETPTNINDYAEKYHEKNGKIIIFLEKKEVSYQDKRLREYPPIGDVIDAICKKIDGDSSEYDNLQLLRNEIKNKYPKAESIKNDE